MAGDFRFRIDNGGLNQLFHSPTGEVAKIITKKAIMVDRMAKQLCPVDTGLLRSSINWRLGVDGRGVYATIGTSTHYAPYVEFGTRYMAAQPFLRPALNVAR
jgi:HK97 gp10 family phage protein